MTTAEKVQPGPKAMTALQVTTSPMKKDVNLIGLKQIQLIRL